MSAVTVNEITFSLGRNHYRVNRTGEWFVLLWGWWPHGPSPSYRWHAIEKKRVPGEVLKVASEKWGKDE